MSEYTAQADNFLKAHNLTFRAVLKSFGPYFAGETESRNIYQLTISGKGRGRYTTRFGQSINGTAKNETPNAYDLLACMTKYHPGSFENFCGDFGYDSDSRKALKTYNSVVRDWGKVSVFFTAEELKELEEIN